METERRFVPVDGIEIREQDGEPKGIAGMAAVYNASTVIAGLFEERIAPGAFDDVIGDDVAGLFNHDPNFPLARTPNTLKLSTTSRGLRYVIAELPKARADVLEAVKRGDVRGNSFSFSLDRDGDEWIDRSDEGKIPLRIIKRVKRLYDVGPVTFPAYEQTSVSARSVERAMSISIDEQARAATPARCAGCAERDATIATLQSGIQKREALLDRALR